MKVILKITTLTKIMIAFLAAMHTTTLFAQNEAQTSPADEPAAQSEVEEVANESNAYNLKLETQLKSRIEQRLKRYLEVRYYLVRVNVGEVNEIQKSIPYLPGPASNHLNYLSDLDLLALIRVATVQIRLAQEVGDELRQTIENILEGTFAFSQNPNLTIEFINLGSVELPISREKIEKFDSISKDLDEEIDKNKSLSEELRQKNDEVNALTGRVQEEQKKHEETTNQKNSFEDKLENSLSTQKQIEDQVEGLRNELNRLKDWEIMLLYLITAVITLIGLLGIFIYYRVAHKGFENLNDSFSSIAESLRAAAHSERSSVASKQSTQTQLQGESRATLAEGSNVQHIKQMKDSLRELQETLNEMVNQDTLPVVIEHFTLLLSQPNQLAQVVAGLEILGSQAESVFSQFSRPDKSKILHFLESGQYPKDKSIMMFESGELLKTKLMTKSFRTLVVKTDHQLRNSITRLNAQAILEVIQKLDSTQGARVLLYLSPDRLSEVLKVSKESSDKSYNQLIKLIPKVAASEKDAKLDKQILDVVTAKIHELEVDLQANYLSFYRSLVDHLDEDSAEHFITEVSQQSDFVKKYFDKNYITYKKFFDLTLSVKKEILQSLSNRELALLFISSSEDQKGMLHEGVSKRRVALLQEDIEILENTDRSELEDELLSMRKRIVQDMRGLNDNGRLHTVSNI